jgi:hypothetical protein
MEPLKEWMYIDKDGSQVGPMEKDAIRRLWSKKDIDWTTRFWASGMLDWKKLRDILELRWALASRVPVITPPQVDHVLPGRYIVIHINIISSVLVFYCLMFFLCLMSALKFVQSSLLA